MKFDDILKEIGEFGPYQKGVYFLVCLPAFILAMHAFIPVFIVGVPKHRCAIPGYDNDTYNIQDDFHSELINRTIPRNLEEDGHEGIYDECNIFVYNSSHVTDDAPGIQLCDRWVYDRKTFTSNAVISMDLVCSRKLYRSHLFMIFVAGRFVGAILSGVVADIFGRKKVLIASCLLTMATGVASGFTTNYVLLSIVRFFSGLAISAIFASAFTIGVELVGPSKRLWTGIVIEYAFSLGAIALAGMAFVIRDWTYLLLAVSLPSIFFISYWWILPESPRWLLSRGRHKEARAIVERIARSNNRAVREQMFNDRGESSDGPSDAGRLWHLFASRVMFRRTLIILFNWFIISMGYYGLSLNTGNLVGSLYLNFFLSCLVEIPAYTICLLFLDRVGRKPLYMTTVIGGGIACVCTIFTVIYAGKDYQWTTTVLSLIGKVGVTAGFGIIYIYSAEVFPTSLRIGSLGTSVACGKLGTMAAPYIADLGMIIGGDFQIAMPLTVFGVVFLLGGILTVFLPETLNLKLPDTIAESENLGRERTGLVKEQAKLQKGSAPLKPNDDTELSLL